MRGRRASGMPFFFLLSRRALWKREAGFGLRPSRIARGERYSVRMGLCNSIILGAPHLASGSRWTVSWGMFAKPHVCASCSVQTHKVSMRRFSIIGSAFATTVLSLDVCRRGDGLGCVG